MSAIAVFRRLDAALFGAAGPDDASIAEEEQWARYNILPPVDVFDHWKGFLVEDEDEQTARLIFAKYPYFDVRELSLKPGDVDAALDVVRNTLSDIHEASQMAQRRQDDGSTPTVLRPTGTAARPTCIW